MKLNENTCIFGKNVVLVPYRQHHVLKYHEWMKSTELQKLTASEPLSLEEEYEMQGSWHRDENKCTFIILEKSVIDGNGDEIAAMIGDTNLFLSCNDSPEGAELEIMIAEESARGKGRGLEGVLLMLRYGGEVLGIKTFVVKIGFDNERSIRMFRKIGFTEVGRSEVFREISLAKPVTPEWIDWLCSETSNATTQDVYSQTFSRVQ